MGEFDPGYGAEPYATLVREAPGPEVFPPADFRIEWGPVFHRGRLDGSARVLVVGQDPAAHEAIARRILVGEAGQRVQAFLARLGITGSYVMVNAFLYSVYGQGAGNRHRDDPGIVAYRNRWLDALLGPGGVEVVVAFGGLADGAYRAWQATPAGRGRGDVAYAQVPHPTWPESSSGGDRQRLAAAYRRLLGDWNAALGSLHPRLAHPDVPGELVLFDDQAPPATEPIPARDLPAGAPGWMRSVQAWAKRSGKTAEDKRATITVTVPAGQRPWH
jgi:hypothetical protein